MEKLVRDKVPEVMRAAEKPGSFRLAAREDRLRLLLAKLLEEAKELAEEPSVAELADVVEVITAIQLELGIDETALRRAREGKAQARGTFELGIVLDIDDDFGV